MTDLMVAYRGQIYLIEVKLPKGRLSANQKKFKAEIESVGCTYHIARSLEDIIDILNLPSKVTT